MMRYMSNCDKEVQPKTQIQARDTRMLDSTVYILLCPRKL